MSARVTATERVQRILAILPWLVQNQGATIGEIAERFAVSPRDVRADLEFVFHNVGLHPFTPDMLSDIFIEEDRVTVHLGDYFHRPLRLTHPEALTLLAAARAMEERPGADPDGTLARAIGKLDAVLGPGAGDAIGVRLGRADPVVFSTVETAVGAQERLRIEYYSYGRDELTTREVDPLRVVAREGNWYLLAHCHSAAGERLFRVDRIAAAEPLGLPVEAPPAPPEVGPDVSGGHRTVEVIGPRSTIWISQMYPSDQVESLDDGHLRTVLPVTARPWLERLMLRLGTSVEVRDVDTGEDLAPLGADAAARVLARYRTDAGSVTADD